MLQARHGGGEGPLDRLAPDEKPEGVGEFRGGGDNLADPGVGELSLDKVDEPARAYDGLLANGSRADNVAKAGALLNVPKSDAIPDDPKSADAVEPPTLSRPCPCCGGRMLIIETFARGCGPKYRQATAPLAIRIDTS